MHALTKRLRLGESVLNKYDTDRRPFILHLRVSPAYITRDMLPFVEDMMWRVLQPEGLGVLGLLNASRGWRPSFVPGHGMAPALEVPDDAWLSTARDLIPKADGIVIGLPAGLAAVPEELELCSAAGRSLLTVIIRPPGAPTALDNYLVAHRFLRVLDDDQVLLTRSFLLDDIVVRMQQLAKLDPTSRTTEFPVSVGALVEEYQSLGLFYKQLGAFERADAMFKRAYEAAQLLDGCVG